MARVYGAKTMKIVSLIPSATEIVFALGLGDALVGVTFECDHPAEAREKTVVSGTALPEAGGGIGRSGVPGSRHHRRRSRQP